MLERMSIMENNRACIIIEPAHAIHEKKKVEVSVKTTILFCQDQVLYWLQKRVLVIIKNHESWQWLWNDFSALFLKQIGLHQVLPFPA